MGGLFFKEKTKKPYPDLNLLGALLCAIKDILIVVNTFLNLNFISIAIDFLNKLLNPEKEEQTLHQ